MTVQMRVYPQTAGVAPGGTIVLCMSPGTPAFRVAFLRQLGTAALAYLDPPEVAGLQFVTRVDPATFSSAPVASPALSDLDHAWPQIVFRVPAAWDSGVYFAAAYPVDANGLPTDALGTAIVGKQAIVPIPPLADGLALFVVHPTAARRKIVYIVAISNYQAYNDEGSGGFYSGRLAVTWRRPGGGVGNPPRVKEADPNDTQSNRNTYMHWDAKFIAWLSQQGIACDFYTSADLEQGCLLSGGVPAYELMLSIGHDEYWSTPMVNAVSAFIGAGGNLAVFSGNTCYRPVAYDAGDTGMLMTRIAESWANVDEAPVIGTTSQAGAGMWMGQRPPLGLSVQQPAHWVFAGAGVTSTTVLAPGTGSTGGRLAGYEVDGLYAGKSPAAAVVLANAFPPIGPWERLGTPPGAPPAVCDMVIFGAGAATPPPGTIANTVFNASTTDWARVLTDTTEPDQPKLQTITLNVIRKLANAS
ncbi:MAG TPA: N,N-dimethylformamidase beta subunit family domain-containing protein [Kofleriaceae bacterium]|jgi:hypothetical protein